MMPYDVNRKCGIWILKYISVGWTLHLSSSSSVLYCRLYLLPAASEAQRSYFFPQVSFPSVPCSSSSSAASRRAV